MTIVEWITNNKFLATILGAIVCVVGYKIFNNMKQKKLEKQKPVQKVEMPVQSFGMIKDYGHVNFMEDNHMEYLNKLHDWVENELKISLATYDKARSDYAEILAVEKKLKKYIPYLEQQKASVELQIERLKQ